MSPKKARVVKSMARPLRIEYPGAWHHVMNRGRRAENKRMWKIWVVKIFFISPLYGRETGNEIPVHIPDNIPVADAGRAQIETCVREILQEILQATVSLPAPARARC